MRRSPPPSVPTHSRPWRVFDGAEDQVLLDQRAPKGLHKRHPTQRHRLQRLRRKDRLRHGLKERLQRGHIPRHGDLPLEQHRRRLPVAPPRQAQGRAQPQRPVPPRHQRRHRIGRQGAVLAA